MVDDVATMLNETKISSTGYWESNIKLYHERCEPLCDWIINYLSSQKDKLLYDFGCGNGQYLKKLSGANFSNLIGVEGKIPKYKDYENIIEHDLTVPFVLPNKGNCLFLEVAEHIPSEYEDIMLNNIISACDDKLIMSWAIKGQGGLGHVNELNNDEVISKITSKGMLYLHDETLSARNTIKPGEFCWWFKNTVLIFKKI